MKVQYGHQKRLATYLYERDAAFGIAPLGAGKGAAALTAFSELIRDGHRRHCVTIAPKLVATTVWPAEVASWPHLEHLRVAVLDGSPERRRELLAAAPEREITVIGVDLVPWLVAELATVADDHPLLDVLIIDETSRLKDPSGKRARALLKVAGRFKTRWGLTGTPRPNSSQDLFMPAAIITNGALWGRAFVPWQKRFFRARDPWGREWTALPGAEERIAADFGTVAMTVADADMPDLPPLNVVVTRVELPDTVMATYRTMQEELFAEIGDRGIEAASPLIATGKLSQISNGFIYSTGNDDAILVHDRKIEWLRELVEALQGEPLLIAYEFVEDLRAIRRAFGEVPALGGETGAREASRLVADWNAGTLPLLAFHPACLSPNTEVLTEHRGWVRIVDVTIEERVFDGVEYVSHGGCAYSGFRPVIEVFGLTMTPDHKLLVNGQWEAAATLPEAALQHDEKRAHVYDLVACGPRHQFLIRNADGEAFISHNSAGHGLNLQFGGSRMAWLSPPWSAELYEQSIARIYRPGQTKHVTIHICVAAETIDEMKRSRVVGKMTAQEAFKQYLGRV